MGPRWALCAFTWPIWGEVILIVENRMEKNMKNEMEAVFM